MSPQLDTPGVQVPNVRAPFLTSVHFACNSPLARPFPSLAWVQASFLSNYPLMKPLALLQTHVQVSHVGSMPLAPSSLPCRVYLGHLALMKGAQGQESDGSWGQGDLARFLPLC